MTSLRWLKLNRTGLCYLPEELAALQKLVSSTFWGLQGSHRGCGVRRGPVRRCREPGACQARGSSADALVSNNRAELQRVVEIGCRSC